MIGTVSYTHLDVYKRQDFEEELDHIMSKVKAECVGREALESICAMKLAVFNWAEEENLRAAATQCWACLLYTSQKPFHIDIYNQIGKRIQSGVRYPP